MKEPLYVQDYGKYIIVTDLDRQLWKFKKRKGKSVIPDSKGGFKKCKKPKS